MSEVAEVGTVENAASEGQDTTVLTTSPEVAPAESAAPAEVQEEYAFEMPDGISLDSASMDEFKSIAKEMKLPADAAKKFVDIAVKRETARLDAHRKQVEDWAAEVKADPELGKNENLAAARLAIERFGSKELRDMLEVTGFGNHPALVKTFFAIGKAISEDTMVRGGNTTPSGAKSFYDASNMNP